MRTLLMAFALVAAQGCRGERPAEHSADFAARREGRYRAFDAQLQVIATQPIVINTMAKLFPLTEAGRALVTAKLQMLQTRFDEAKNQVALVRTCAAEQCKDAEDRAAAAMRSLDDARKDAWDALDKAPRADRSS